MAREQDLDLVEVADKADPPVCRIMDYGNYEYQAAKRARESRRKSSTTVLKEMKYRPKIGSGDFDTKTKKVERFLSEGHKVKVTIMFRGREVYHPELGTKILDHVAEAVSHLGRVEVYPKGVEGRNMTMVWRPTRRRKPSTPSTRSRRSPTEVTTIVVKVRQPTDRTTGLRLRRPPPKPPCRKQPTHPRAETPPPGGHLEQPTSTSRAACRPVSSRTASQPRWRVATEATRKTPLCPR